MDEFPPPVLAGPILRRCDTSIVTVWLATSRKLGDDVQLSVFERTNPQSIIAKPLDATFERKTVKVGKWLYVHLFIARARRSTFPTGKLLSYYLSMGELDYENLVYDKTIWMPTFFLQPADTGIRIMHGSCRKPYGIGADALAAADTLIGESLTDIQVKADKNSSSGRPAVLYLHGDQIYADDVEENLFKMVRKLADYLFAYEKKEHIPTLTSNGNEPLSTLTYGKKRKEFTRNVVHFTTDDGEGHLLGLSEYCAMYLLVWSQLVWWKGWVRACFPKDDGGFKYPGALHKMYLHKAYFRGQLGRDSAFKVKDMYKSLPAVRRAMANVPCYMIFDDHDVTDDWNLDAKWKRKVEESDAGRRVVANALAAYWLFQGWGNNPDSFPNDFKKVIQDYCNRQAKQQGLVDSADEVAMDYEDTLWNYSEPDRSPQEQGWIFHVPTDPPTIFADMRTQREFGTVGPNLVSPKAYKRLNDLANEAGHKPGKPLVIISSLPVLNHPILALGQDLKRGKLNSRERADWEQWRNNQRGTISFLKFVGDVLKPGYCIFLSGEIHHSVSAGIDIYVGRHNIELLNGDENVYFPEDQNWRMIQLTSSPLKNESEEVAKWMVPNGLFDWLTGSDVESQTLVFLRGPTPASDFLVVEPLFARRFNLNRVLMIEKDDFVRDSSREADTPIQPRSCLGVVTIIPGSVAVSQEFCVVKELKEFAPQIEKRWSVVDTMRSASPTL